MKRTGANGKSKFSIFMLFALSVFITSTSLAQMNIRLGATAGGNFASVVKDEEVLDLKAGFRGGMVADFGLHKNFSIVPELLFSQKGWKTLKDDDNPGFGQTVTINYLELPVNLVVKFKVAPETRIILFPAFYAGYALSGKIKQKDEGGTTSMKPPFGKGEDEMNPLDMGLNLGLGLEIKSVFFRFQVHAGLKNLSNDKSETVNNTAVSLNLGYFIK
jgi:hypothetical protein